MLRLRPYKKCDAKYIVNWIKDEKSFRQWCADKYESYPITDQDMNEHYESLADSDAFFPMTAFDESGVVGHLIMRFVDEDKNILRFGFIMVDFNKRGKGYGKEMILLALKYAFEILKVKKVTLGVFENNMGAYYCYKAAGFKEEDVEMQSYKIMGEDWKCIELGVNI